MTLTGSMVLITTSSAEKVPTPPACVAEPQFFLLLLNVPLWPFVEYPYKLVVI